MDKIFEYAFIGTMYMDKMHIDRSEDEIIDVLRECIYMGIDINQNESKILSNMVRKNKVKVVNFLIDNNINIRSNNDMAFLQACNTNNIELIKLFISLGIPANTNNNLGIRFEKLNLTTIKLLVEYGADPFSSNNAIFRGACRTNNTEIIKYLLELNPDLCSNDDNLIVYAFQDDPTTSLEIKKLLLDHRANPNVKYNNGRYLLESSISNNDFAECKLLLEHYADINLCNFKELYDEDDFYRYNKNDLIKIVNLYLEYGLDLREQMRNLI